jgi:acetyl esterase/lipase
MSEDWSVLSRPAPGPDEVIRYGELDEHVIDLWQAHTGSEHPLVVIVHGGFWRPEYDRIHTRPQANALREAGYDVASIEYRRNPGDPDAMVSDVKAALAVFDRPMVIIGHSAGGHLVLWAAAAARLSTLRGTIALAPVADLMLAERLALDTDAVTAFLGASADQRPDLDPAVLASPDTPVIIVHGRADEIVPISVAQSYVDQHPTTRLVLLDGVAHFALIDPLSSAWAAILTELSSLT